MLRKILDQCKFTYRHYSETQARNPISNWSEQDQGRAARQNAYENIDTGSHVNINYHWLNMVECDFMQLEM